MKNVGGMVKLGLILGVFATAACVMLSFVYIGTSKIIAEREEADLQAALKEIFPEADGFEAAEGLASPDDSVRIHSAFQAIRGGRPVGVALRLSRGGYSGPITMMVGVSAEGIITGLTILGHSETPGLGANAASKSFFVDRARGVTFYGQFAGKKASDPLEVKGDVVAITASTVTSRAVAAAVKAAGLAVAAWFAGSGGAR